MQDVYGSVRGDGKYVESIAAGEEDDIDDDSVQQSQAGQKKSSYSAPQKFIQEAANTAEVRMQKSYRKS